MKDSKATIKMKNKSTDAKIEKIVEKIIGEIENSINHNPNVIPEEHLDYLINELGFENNKKNDNLKTEIKPTLDIDNENFNKLITQMDVYQNLYNANDTAKLVKSKKILRIPRKLVHREITDFLLFPIQAKQTHYNVAAIHTIKFLYDRVRIIYSENVSVKSTLESLRSENV